MIHLLHQASTTQFVLGCIAFISLVMILLQTAVRRSVSMLYVIAFFVTVIWLAVTLR